MKKVVEMLLEMEQVTEDVKIAVEVLLNSTDEDIVTGLVVELSKKLNNVSIANSVSALSFILGMVLSNDNVLTQHEKLITLSAFCASTKAAIEALEDDD